MRPDGPGQAVRLLLDIAAVLHTEQVDYAVIGALAAAVHGVVRASLDADAIIRITTRELGDLQGKLSALGYEAQIRRGDAEDPIAALLQVSDAHGNQVDLLVGLRGMDAGAFSRGLDVGFEAGSLRVVGREDFIAMKLFAGGPIDIADASGVLAAAGAELDVGLLRRLAAGYGRSVLQECEKLLTGR
jgi:hypothetical protein